MSVPVQVLLIVFVGVTFGQHANIQANFGGNRIEVLDPNIQNKIAVIRLPEAQIPLEAILQNEWETYKRIYNKVYSAPSEENFRREIFIENRNKVKKFNEAYSTGGSTFVQQLNFYADMLHHEFMNALNGFNRTRPGAPPKPSLPTPSAFIPAANVPFPQHVDWRELGGVTRVRSQGLCAACWAFSAVGALEGHVFRKTGNLVELSEQNLLDCSGPYGTDGCDGGQYAPAWEYVRNQPGVDTLQSYPYEAKVGQCRWTPENVGAYCTGYVEIPEGDERAMEIAVATLGPVAAAMDAGQDSFQFYSNGVYYDKNCKDKLEEGNHAVLIVGYGTEPNGQKYWIIKNSYGPNWGIGGYFKLARDVKNHCGIANSAAYPLV